MNVGTLGKTTIAASAIALLVGTSAAVGAEAPTTASAYVNPDTGTATENGNVAEGSSCMSPDRRDRQALSDEGGSNRNVHVDACLSTSDGAPFDGMATFASTGRGSISACPDPDQAVAQVPQVMNGPRLAFVHDHDGDGRNDHCHQTGYQERDAAGDEEYHVRVNNDTKRGRQRVTFCYDPEQDASADASGQPAGHGCADSSVKSRVVVVWTRR
jgi:hypothetical protein